MAEAQSGTMTVEEFYQRQLDQDERYELVEGVPVPLRAMTGASNVHDVILVNCIAELGARLRGKPCRVASAATALRISFRTVRRPDVTIDCASPERSSYEAHCATVVVDMLAPIRRELDRFTKLDEYRRHLSLRHVLLIDPDSVEAKLYSRPEGGAWTDVDLFGKEALIALDAVDISLPLGALYDCLQ
jgi:Uma2 family endonuclease